MKYTMRPRLLVFALLLGCSELDPLLEVHLPDNAYDLVVLDDDLLISNAHGVWQRDPGDDTWERLADDAEARRAGGAVRDQVEARLPGAEGSFDAEVLSEGVALLTVGYCDDIDASDFWPCKCWVNRFIFYDRGGAIDAEGRLQTVVGEYSAAPSEGRDAEAVQNSEGIWILNGYRELLLFADPISSEP